MESHKSFLVWLLRHTVLGRRGSQLRVVSQGDLRVGGGGGEAARTRRGWRRLRRRRRQRAVGGLKLGETGCTRAVARVLLHQCGTTETGPSENHVGGCERALVTVAPITEDSGVGDLFVGDSKATDDLREGK